MHFIAEIVIPPTKDIKASIGEIMDYFLDEDDTGEKKTHADWWDFWVIGGRFSGHKLEASLDTEKMRQFREELIRRKVTVSGVVFGKEELQPASQIPMVDGLWREFFPGTTSTCPLFDHSRDRYGREGMSPDDVCTVANIPERLKCSRLIVAGPHWKDSGRIQPKRMLVAEFWNRVEHQETTFDGNVKKAVAEIRGVTDGHKAVKGLADDWLVVTVDYHN